MVETGLTPALSSFRQYRFTLLKVQRELFFFRLVVPQLVLTSLTLIGLCTETPTLGESPPFRLPPQRGHGSRTNLLPWRSGSQQPDRPPAAFSDSLARLVADSYAAFARAGTRRIGRGQGRAVCAPVATANLVARRSRSGSRTPFAQAWRHRLLAHARHWWRAIAEHRPSNARTDLARERGALIHTVAPRPPVPCRHLHTRNQCIPPRYLSFYFDLFPSYDPITLAIFDTPSFTHP